MTVFAVRVFSFSILPLLIGAGILLIDRSASTRERRLETLLIQLFYLGVAGSGIGSFFGHFFLSDLVADSVNWPRGSPFQLEMAFANLALGLLGIVAAGRRDGFREATVIAVTVVGLGATIVHLIDMVATANLAPGNTIQNIANVIKPAFLIPLLIASRRAERSPDSECRSPHFDVWRAPLLLAAAIVTGVVGTAFGLGFALERLLVASALGVIAASAVTAIILARSPTHRLTGHGP
jgi:hypothetical protein